MRGRACGNARMREACWAYWTHGCSVRPDQINLLFLGFAGCIFCQTQRKKGGGQRLNSMRMRSSAFRAIWKMAAISGPGTYLSVRVQSGCRTLLTKIRFTPLSVTFAELFLNMSEEDDRVGERCVYKVTIADRPGNVRSRSQIDLATEEIPKWT